MARAFWNESDEQWTADFRGVGMKLKQRRRVRLDRKAFPRAAADQAHAIAAECDRYCRLLEIGTPDPADVEHAARIKAIGEDQLDRLRAALPPGAAVAPSRQWSLKDAAKAHPSTQRDERMRATEAVLNLRHLRAFAEFSGNDLVARVKLGDVLAWVAKMKKDGVSWEGRRHRLLYLRRACKMATTQGLPDAIAGLRIDHKEDGDVPAVEAWTLDELGRGAARLEDPRALAALGLGGFCGLRPSECARLIIGDLRGDLLDVGKRKRKNRASGRTLPLPATVARWCAALVGKRKPEAPLIAAAAHRQERRAFTAATWAQWLGPLLTKATGRELPPKCLRKAFTSWAPGVLAGRDVERYLGHQSAFLAQVSSTKYQADRAAAELRPAAVLIEQALADAVERAKKQPKRAPLPRKVATKSQVR
jgi:integrase